MKTSKLTPKQEQFAQNISKGMTQSDAYRDAYSTENFKDESIHCNSSQLASDTKVLQRIEELKAEAAKRYEITKEEIVDALRLAKELSMDKKDLTNLRGSAMDLAKIGGLIVDYKKHSGEIVKKSVQLTKEEYDLHRKKLEEEI